MNTSASPGASTYFPLLSGFETVRVVAQRPVLRQAHHRVIDRLVAMRMIFADDIANDPRAFLVGGGGIQLQQPHRPQEAAMHRLQAVADVRQRPRGDRRQRIDEVALAQSRIERRVDDEVVGGIGLHGDALATLPFSL